MSGDSDSDRTHYHGSGVLVRGLIQTVHECRNVCITIFCIPLLMHFPVYRVSWLRAKARLARWLEELQLVKYEMEWTVNWFHNKAKQWHNRLKDWVKEERAPGLDCYRHKQIVLWSSLADQAEAKFSSTLKRPLFP